MAEADNAVILPTSINTNLSLEEQHAEKVSRDADLDASLDTGWAWVIAIGSFCSLMVQSGLVYGTGMLQIALLETYHQNISKTAWVGAIFSGLASFIGSVLGNIECGIALDVHNDNGCCTDNIMLINAAPVAAMIINCTSCRVAMISGSILAMIGFAASAVVRDFDLLIFTCGIVAGSGVGITYTTAMVVIGYNFNHKRNLVSGIVVSAGGIGAFLMPMVWQTLSDSYNLSGTFLIIGGITLNMCIAGALYRPSRLELKLKMSSPCHCGVIRPPSSSCKSFSLLSNVPFLLFCISILLWSTGLAGVYLHLPSYALSSGFSDSSALFLVSVLGIASIPGKILTGIAASSTDVDELVLYGGSFGLTGIATLLLPLVVKYYAGYVIYAFVCGFYSGGVYATLLTITTCLVGIDNLSGAFAAEMIFCGIGYFIGPPLAGIVYESSGSYEYSFYVVGMCLFLGGLFGFLTKVGSSHVSNVDMNVDEHPQEPERQHLK